MSYGLERQIYWETVVLCLVTFFARSEGEAQTLVRQREEHWAEIAGKRWSLLPYHQEPLNVAEDLAGERISSGEGQRKAYATLVASAEANVRGRTAEKKLRARRLPQSKPMQPLHG